MDYSSVYKPESMNPILYRVTDHSVLSAKECSLGIQGKSSRVSDYYIGLTNPQTHVLESKCYSPILLKNIENKGDFYNGKE